MTATQLFLLMAGAWTLLVVVSIVMDWVQSSPKRRFRPGAAEMPRSWSRRRAHRRALRADAAHEVRTTLAASYGRSSLRLFGSWRHVPSADEVLAHNDQLWAEATGHAVPRQAEIPPPPTIDVRSAPEATRVDSDSHEIDMRAAPDPTVVEPTQADVSTGRVDTDDQDERQVA